MTENFASLSGRQAVVTGASSGIGRAIALELARAGANVVVHYAKSRKAAETVAADIAQLGVRSSAVAADLSKTQAAETLVDTVWQSCGRADIWVNNAGVDLLTTDRRTAEYAAKLDMLYEVDVRASILLTKLVAERMQTHGSGTILTIGWDQSDRGMEGDSGELFSAAKNAVMGATRSLAVSHAPQVRINCIAPGWIRTAWGEHAPQEWQDRVIRETPLQRWGEPEDIAKLARFLVSDEASYITGQVINANGGAVR